MLFADEPFWKPPNVFDVLSVVAFVVGVGSVWFSWWLAKRDIGERLNKAAEQAATAARDEVRRVARGLLQTGLGNTIRFLELAREAANGRQWARAADLCRLSREQLVRVLSQPATDAALVTELRELPGRLLAYLTALESQPKNGVGRLTNEVQRALDEVLLVLHAAEQRVQAIRVE